METNTVLNQIGNTPLIRLKQASELTGCNIYGKAEYFNPGESVKDRAALFIVQDALKRKLISKMGLSRYIKDYYLSNSICRASKTMAKLAKARNSLNCKKVS